MREDQRVDESGTETIDAAARSRLTAEQLATEAGVDPGYVHRLVRALDRHAIFTTPACAASYAEPAQSPS